MANLMIAAPQVATNAESPEVRTRGEMPADPKSAATAFDQSLKTELVNEAKKEEEKKLIESASVIPNALSPNKIIHKSAQVEKAIRELPNKKLPAGKVEEAPGSEAVEKFDKSVVLGNSGKAVTAETIAAEKFEQEKDSSIKINSALNEILASNAVPGMVETAGARSQVPNQAAPNARELNSKLSQVDLRLMPQVAVATQGKVGIQSVNPNAALAKTQVENSAEEMEMRYPFTIESVTSESDAVESLGAPNPANSSKIFRGRALEEKSPLVNKGSTSDYLSLRDLTRNNGIQPATLRGATSGGSELELGTSLKNRDGKKDKFESLGGREAIIGGLANRLELGTHSKIIDAPVTEGSGGSKILSHDALKQLTDQVGLMSQAKLDGEIKIRLRPEHLGELQMSVKSHGQQVSIEIRAQNSESKKIIEESISNLKESLAQQNIGFSRVDVVSGPTLVHAQASLDQGMQMDMSQFRQNSGQNSAQNFEQGNSNRDSFFDEMSAPTQLNSSLNSIRRTGVNRARAGEGLDLIA